MAAELSISSAEIIKLGKRVLLETREALLIGSANVEENRKKTGGFSKDAVDAIRRTIGWEKEKTKWKIMSVGHIENFPNQMSIAAATAARSYYSRAGNCHEMAQVSLYLLCKYINDTPRYKEALKRGDLSLTTIAIPSPFDHVFIKIFIKTSDATESIYIDPWVETTPIKDPLIFTCSEYAIYMKHIFDTLHKEEIYWNNASSFEPLIPLVDNLKRSVSSLQSLEKETDLKKLLNAAEHLIEEISKLLLASIDSKESLKIIIDLLSGILKYFLEDVGKETSIECIKEREKFKTITIEFLDKFKVYDESHRILIKNLSEKYEDILKKVKSENLITRTFIQSLTEVQYFLDTFEFYYKKEVVPDEKPIFKPWMRSIKSKSLKIDIESGKNWSRLMTAIKRNDADTVNKLLAEGVQAPDVNQADFNGDVPLFFAAKLGHKKT